MLLLQDAHKGRGLTVFHANLLLKLAKAKQRELLQEAEAYRFAQQAKGQRGSLAYHLRWRAGVILMRFGFRLLGLQGKSCIVDLREAGGLCVQETLWTCIQPMTGTRTSP